MRLWLEQEPCPDEGRSAPVLRLPEALPCSPEERGVLEDMAASRTIGIWRMKRAKIILGVLEGRSLEELVLYVRVPPESVVKAVEAFSRQGLKSLDHPTRKPSWREARVEKMLAVLEAPSRHTGEDRRAFSLRYIGIDFTGPMLLKIRHLLRAHPDAPRTMLARIVCETFGFRTPGGKARISTLSDVLKRMDMDNVIRLPKAPIRRYQKRPPSSKPLIEAKTIDIHHPRDLEPLSFVLIRTMDEQGLWNEMMGRHHYLRREKLFGPQLRYLIRGKAGEGGLEASLEDGGSLLGAIGFSPAAWRLASRDAFVGWDDAQRERGLKRVVGNSRFLILPWIKCPNLASMILGRIAKRLPSDWEKTYGVRPVLLETFVQKDRFRGTCYKAANWIEVGVTKGYSYFSGQKKTKAEKTVFLYPLQRDFKRALCPPPERCSNAERTER